MSKLELEEELGYWLDEQFYAMESGDPMWPSQEHVFNKEDVLGTIKFLNQPYQDDTVLCGLTDISSKAFFDPTSINRFFYAMYCTGNGIVSRQQKHLVKEIQSHVAVIEMASLIFAALACKRFFNIVDFSENMATEIGSSMVDFETVNGYEAEDKKDRIEIAVEAFKELLDKSITRYQ